MKTAYYAVSLFLFLPVFMHGQATFVNRNDLLREVDLHSAVPVAIADMNGDGLDDIVAMDHGRTLYVQYQTPDPERPFVRYDIERAVDIAEQNDICIADFNNDGALDVLTVGSYDKVKLFYAIANTYGFNLVTYTVTPFFSQGASAGDFNHDGWMDVVFLNDNGANYTMLNDGAGNLVVQDLFNFVTVPASDNSGNYGSLYTDFDMDGDLDLYIAKCRQGINNPSDPRRINVLHVNDGNGHYTEMAAKYGLAVGHQTWTADFGDVDNDGDLDCFMTQHDVVCELYENIGNDTFVDITNSTGLAIGGVPLQGLFRDFDNDGYLDILVSGDRVDFWHNNGDKTFTKTDPFNAVIFGTYALGDLNHDGFTDIYASRVVPFNNPDPLREDILYLNQPNGNHFIALTLKQKDLNQAAIGAMALLYGKWGTQVREIRSGEQYGISNSHQLIFGLGQETTFDSLIIRWPDGTREKYQNLDVDQFHTIQKGGCTFWPYSFWDPSAILCNGDSIKLAVNLDFSPWHLAGWSTGSVTDSLTVTDAGLYYAVLESVDNCIQHSYPIEIATDPDSIQPSIFYEGKPSLCRGDYAELVLPGAIGYTWSTGETTQSIIPTESGDYYAVVQGYCREQNSDTIHLDFLYPEQPVTTTDTFEMGEDAVLFATGDSINWYADPFGVEFLGSGNELTLSGLTGSDTVYAEHVGLLSGLDFQVGPVNQEGNTKYNATFVNGGEVFTVQESLVLQQVTVFTDTLGERLIEITNGSGYYYSKLVDLQAGATVIDLDAELTPGTYTLGTNNDHNMQEFGVASPYLWRSSSGILYPFVIPGILSIDESTFGGDFFYYFYDWKVRTKDRYCTSVLEPAIAYFDMGVGIDEWDQSDWANVFPNPTNGLIRFTTQHSYPVLAEIFTSTGENILRSTYNLTRGQEGQLDISAFPSGLYFIRLSDAGTNYTAKILKL